MSAFVSALNILQTMFVAGFVVATFSLLGMTLLYRLRIGPAVFTWRPEPVRRFPYGASSFIILIAAIEIMAREVGSGIEPLLLAGLGLGSLAWFMAGWMSGVAVANHSGIIQDVLHPDRVIEWQRVTDYFEVPAGSRTALVVLYRSNDGPQSRVQLRGRKSMRNELASLMDCHLQIQPGQPEPAVPGKKVFEK